MKFKTVNTIHAPRSRQDLSYGHKTSMNVGTLYPIYVEEILPGDSLNVDTSIVTRVSSSFLRPVMDNLYLDVYFFYVPSRLCYDKWAEIFGENNDSAWAQTVEYRAPHSDTSFNVPSKTVADYLGLPVGYVPKGVNVIPFRAFALIYNDWFRDENIIDPMHVYKDSWKLDEVPNNEPWGPSNYFGKLPKVAKFHDVFTSSLPSTQKSLNPVDVPIGDFAPLIVGDRVRDFGGSVMLKTDDTSGSSGNLMYGPSTVGNGNHELAGSSTNGVPSTTIYGSNLGADLASAGLLSVPDLRYAFQLQRILERSSRSGTRMTEYLLSAFGVSAPDARMMRPEYLGGKRIPISVQQVAQTTRGSGETEELGSLGAFSLTNGKMGFNKGFVEHGFVIGVACIRQYHSYQQGVEKFWQRNGRFDYYDPILNNISEQPVYTSELFASGDELKGDIFGFQEAWYGYRNRMNHISGDMRSDSDTSLDIWHFADDYEYAPTLTPDFINETPEYVDRTLAVPSTSMDQFIVDIWHRVSAVRRVGKNSIPGLIDHH